MCIDTLLSWKFELMNAFSYLKKVHGGIFSDFLFTKLIFVYIIGQLDAWNKINFCWKWENIPLCKEKVREL